MEPCAAPSDRKRVVRTPCSQGASRPACALAGGDDLLGCLDEGFHRLDGLLEHRPLLGIELDMDDALDAAFTDHHRHADIEALHAILAVEKSGAGQHAL